LPPLPLHEKGASTIHFIAGLLKPSHTSPYPSNSYYPDLYSNPRRASSTAYPVSALEPIEKIPCAIIAFDLFIANTSRI
jgi:hypothetical protein